MADNKDSAQVYDTPDRTRTFTPGATPDNVTNTTIVAPTDRVRWGPIMAGLFAALSTLVVLSVLGLAVGLSSYDAGDALGNFGMGAGLWGAVSTLLAFLIGGWLAARSAATVGRSNGMLNGAMVWVVAIPLILYLLSSGIGSLLGTAGNIAATGAAAAAPVAAEAAAAAADQPGAQATAEVAGGNLADAAQATASALGEQVTDERVAQAAETAGDTAWGTLLALLVGLAASVIGGSLGARSHSTAELVTA